MDTLDKLSGIATFLFGLLLFYVCFEQRQSPLIWLAPILVTYSSVRFLQRLFEKKASS